jgi:glycosyltransferase involved in cell wall biosynthesis
MRSDDLLGPLRVLYLVHALPPYEFAAVPLIAYDYAKRSGNRGWATTVVSADPAVTGWSDVRESRDKGQWFTRIAVPPTSPGTWGLLEPSAPRDPRSPATRFFLHTLRRLKPDLVHVVDNVDLPLDWPELAAEAGIPVVRTVSSNEDLCALVPPVSPRSGPSGFCPAPLTPETCVSCVTAQPGSPMPVWPDADRLLERLEAKRSRARQQFGSVFERIVFSNPDWRRYFESTLPLDPARVRVIEAGMDLAPWSHRPARASKDPGDPVELVLAGVLHPAKGRLDAVQAFTRPELADRDDYRLRFLGRRDPGVLAPLLRSNPNVEDVGPYEPGDLPALLASADVGLSTSVFETLHRVTREYRLAGLPVVANRTFGVEDLVADGENGLLYDRSEPDGLARAVCRILDDRALLGRLTAGSAATRSTIRSIDDETADLVALYGEVVRAHPRPAGHRGLGRLSALSPARRR